METIFLGLGSNLEDRHKNIERAVTELEKAGIVIEKISSIIETDPVGGPPQGKFLNAALKGTTNLPPQELLNQIKNIEQTMGRIPGEINGPRIIDIDILLYSNLRLSSPQLTIPHPRMFHRDFVIVPLKEIEPEIKKEFYDANYQPR